MKKSYINPICETVEYMPLNAMLITISVGPKEQEAGAKSNTTDDESSSPWYQK